MDYDTAVKLSEIEKSIAKIEARLAEANKEIGWVDSKIKKEDKRYSEVLNSAVSPIRKNLSELSEKIPEIEAALASVKNSVNSPHGHEEVNELASNLEREVGEFHAKVSSIEKSLGNVKRELAEPHSHEELPIISSQLRSLKKNLAIIEELKKKTHYLESIFYEASQPKFEPKEFEKKISKLSSELRAMGNKLEALFSESAVGEEKISKKISELEASLTDLVSGFSEIENSISSLKSSHDYKIKNSLLPFQSSLEKLKAEILSMKSQIALAYSNAEKSLETLHIVKSVESSLSKQSQRTSEISKRLEDLSYHNSALSGELSKLKEISKTMESLASSQELEDLREEVELLSKNLKNSATQNDLHAFKQNIFSLQQVVEKLKTDSHSFATAGQLSEFVAKLRQLETHAQSVSKSVENLARLKEDLERNKIQMGELEERLIENIDESKREASSYSEKLEEKIGGEIKSLSKKIESLPAVSEELENISANSEHMRKDILEIQNSTQSLIEEVKNFESLKSRLSELESNSKEFLNRTELEAALEESGKRVNKSELSKILSEVSDKYSELVNSINSKLAEQNSKVSETNLIIEKNMEELSKLLEYSKLENSKSIEDMKSEIVSASEEAKRISEEKARALKAEILPEIEKNSSSIESLSARVDSEIEVLRSSVNSDFATKSELSESLKSTKENFSKIENKLDEIPKELKGETLMKVSPLIDEMRKINSELKKLEALDARIGMIEGARYTEELLALKTQIENFNLLRTEMEGMKKIHSEIPKELRSSSAALDQRIKTLEGKFQKLGVQMLVETEKRSAGHEKKISEVSKSVEDVKAATEKISSADEKLLRLEEQNMLIARTLSDNMNVLRDWSSSVEARLSQIFQLQTSLIKELEKARAYQSK